MNLITFRRAFAILFALTTMIAFRQRASAQGSLTPPGAPAASMLSLDQIGAKTDALDTKLGALEAKSEKRTPIDATNTAGNQTSSFVISQPGSYFLTGNLTGEAGKTGILLKSNDVSIDLNGFTMTGTGGTAKGIDGIANTPTRIRIFNGQVKGWGGAGVFLYRNCTVDHVIASGNNGLGIGADSGSVISQCVAESNVTAGFSLGSDTIISHCTGSLNDTGLSLSDNGRAEHCVFNSNGHNGITLGTGTSVTDCTANFNGAKAAASGMIVSTNESRSTISRSTCLGNNGAGIILGSNCVVSECTITSNTLDGITTTSGITQKQNRVTRCLINGNAATTGNGVTLIEASSVTDCTVCENGSASNLASGIKMRAGARVSGCTANNNFGRGIYVAASSVVRDNSAGSNGIYGIDTTFLTGNGSSVEANYVRDNISFGIVLGSFDVAIRNVAGGNGPTNTSNYSPNNGSLSPVQAASNATNPFANISLSQ